MTFLRHTVRFSLFLLAIIAATPTSQAMAHAIVLTASPTLNSIVQGSSTIVELKFNSRIDHSHSRLALIKADGPTVNLLLDQDTEAHILRSTASNLIAGEYRVRWQVLSVDGHITRGDINFTVQ